ncbi:hypothetical protein [Emcibacter sp. SYSU 3D8]|uniref:cell division protein FtsL n=1 Tax=Emcibacter sp. SYSU 3D8 TaxID=3133969 RepID=UPI0031FE4AAB
MKRSITLITLCVLVVVSYGLYNLKYEVEDLQDHANSLRAQMDEDRRAIKVLEAEWAYLSRPDRLQKLSQKFLPLQPTVAKQVGNVADLRLKLMDEILAPLPVLDTIEAANPAAIARPSTPPAVVRQSTPPAPPPAADALLVPVANTPPGAARLESVQ